MGHLAEEVDAVADPGRRGLSAEVVHEVAAPRHDQVDPVVTEASQGGDRDVEALEVMRSVERRHEGGDHRPVRDP